MILELKARFASEYANLRIHEGDYDIQTVYIVAQQIASFYNHPDHEGCTVLETTGGSEYIVEISVESILSIYRDTP